MMFFIFQKRLSNARIFCLLSDMKTLALAETFQLF